MKKIHKANLGFVAGVALLGYGAGLVSVQPSNAEPKGGFGGGPTGPARDDDDRGPRDGRGPGGPGGPGGGRGMRGGPGMVDGKAAGPMLHRLLEDIDLSDTQLDKIEDVQDKERAQMDALRKQMEEIQKRSRSSIDNILTADQRKQLEKAEKEMAQNDQRGGRGPGRGQGGPGRGGPGGERPGGDRGGPPRGGGDDFED